MDDVYNITYELTNCTSDKDNPSTVDPSAESTALKFDAKPNFPFNSYIVKVTGADKEVAIAADKRSVTVTISNVTGDVEVDVTAEIYDSLNNKYIVVNDVLYKVFNNRLKVRWNKRWLRDNL